MRAALGTAVYVLLLAAGYIATAPQYRHVTLNIAVFGLACFILLQLTPRHTRREGLLGALAVWAVLSVLAAPFTPVFQILGDAVRGAL